jgi:UPF0755 protein
MTRRRAWAVVIAVSATLSCRSPRNSQDVVEITIPRGATLQAAAETLAAHGVVPSTRLLRFYARVSGRERAIQAGTYRFPASASVREVLEQLGTGRSPEVRIVVHEGETLRETLAAIGRTLDLESGRLLAAASDSALRDQLGVTAPTLEGYLFPSTYFVPVDAEPLDVIRQMTRAFQEQWKPEWNARLDSLHMTRQEIVTLASIIEGEVRYGPDRPYVSSVYRNRLDRGMRLQADPTVAYALGERRRLFERDYLVRSPYNTYVVDGLPPGPIGAPSTASIVAALYPAHTNFLYFVARPDGRHVFSRTYAEHRRAVADVRRMEGRQ